MSLLLLLGDTDSNPRSLFANGEQGGDTPYGGK